MTRVCLVQVLDQLAYEPVSNPSHVSPPSFADTFALIRSQNQFRS